MIFKVTRSTELEANCGLCLWRKGHRLGVMVAVVSVVLFLTQTPLHLAAITDNAQIVEDLIIAGSDMNLPDRNGRTAAHLCAIHHSRESLRILGQADIEEDSLPAKQPACGTPRLQTEVRDYEGEGGHAGLYICLHTCLD